MGFVKESPIPADGVELLKEHGMYTGRVERVSRWATEREIYLTCIDSGGLADEFANTYGMLFEGYDIYFVVLRFWTVKDWVFEDKKVVEPAETALDIQDLVIPPELASRRDEVLEAIEEGMTALLVDTIATINKIF
ncbi:hypothetical protein [Streptococcus oricebi]|uniref:DUF402 domain-containing protein n=1 Tax=Streptococcus oricebi TaxID=1547447 RepID=A0ABS5B359_9STRE|nr:hypothetical protein [Streptococcus oricebi]MBP2623259.1 hypothetical protein [Streptococcus oricebi]